MRKVALLAEEIVEEWLNQQGYFTIRGIRLGVDEMDILAVKLNGGEADLRHYEVQASIRPISYISSVPKAVQKSERRKANSAKVRSIEELSVGIREWIEKKFLHPKKQDLRNKLIKGSWSFHFVVNEVAHREELEILERSEVSVVRLKDILESLKNDATPTFTASGKDLVDLILMDRAQDSPHT